MGSLGALPPYPQGQAVHECACLWPGARSTWWSWQLPKPSGPVAESAGPAAVALAGGGARGATCLAGGGPGRRCLPSRLGVRAVSAASLGGLRSPPSGERAAANPGRTNSAQPSQRSTEHGRVRGRSACRGAWELSTSRQSGLVRSGGLLFLLLSALRGMQSGTHGAPASSLGAKRCSWASRG